MFDEPANERHPSTTRRRPEHRDSVAPALIDQPRIGLNQGSNGTDIPLARQYQCLLEHVLRGTVVHQTSRGLSQQVHDSGLSSLGYADVVHGRAEVCEPPNGLVGTNETMGV